uniref:Ovule protein n=1 Tax=Caenorhabditis tropicalis TaxID=1561998 RepID=A0A1I7SZ41_9PELO
MSIGDVFQLMEELFDFSRIHIFSSFHNHISCSSNNINSSILIHNGSVPGFIPSVTGNRQICFILIRPVSEHCRISTRP